MNVVIFAVFVTFACYVCVFIYSNFVFFLKVL